MKHYRMPLLLLTVLCAALWFGVLPNMAAAFVTQIFFVVFLLLFVAALDPAPV